MLFSLWLPAVHAADGGQPVLVDIKRMSLDTALKLAQATIKTCRKEGVQVAVTVVDRGGHPQVVLRDVLAQDFTLQVSKLKAYTAMTFNSVTSTMVGRFKDPFSIGKIDSIVISAGGVPISAGGNIIGGVGVSGAPSGETDEKCAKAGLAAVMDDLEMASME
ncbi:MAG: heme-binding protein [Gammaproteobacteria bacterium]|nr:heme-binding protein [Gammaproteobacteria bacterium]